MTSYIYNEIPEAAWEECGYFKPKTCARINNHGFAAPVAVGKPREIDSETLILYFPGSFGTFHQGHAECVRNSVMEAMRITRNVAVVISPANSDYTVQKYGAWSVNASNKHRFEQIKKFAPCPLYIDINPMMNYTCDQNFTDLISDFTIVHLNRTVGSMKHAPWIICGKDRAYFMKLNDYTNKVKVHFTKGSSDQSTSASLGGDRKKKKVILRGRSWEEYELFTDYFHDQYELVSFMDIREEIDIAYKFAKYNNIRHTICKDYREILEYFPVHRRWDDPFTQSEDFDFMPSMMEVPYGARFLDSDIFSGSTKFFMGQRGYNLFAVADYTDRRDIEVIDVSDLRGEWKYPFVDISFRASMRSFDHNFHQEFKRFKTELENV